VIVFNDGANDVDIHNTKMALLQITKFIQDNNQTKVIIILDVPHR
jgi:hypothetical protein